MLRRGGCACLAGFLGGLVPVPDFNPLLQMSSGVHLSFFGSFVFGKPGFHPSDELKTFTDWHKALDACEDTDLIFVDMIATLKEPHQVAGYEEFALAFSRRDL